MDVFLFNILQKLICVIVGYVCGLFSTALIIGYINGNDLRKQGSGNLGSTNALRIFGWKAGIISFIGDVAKSVFAMLILYFFIFPKMSFVLIVLYAGLGLTLGHNFPVHLKFRGGKGIAVMATVVLMYDCRLAIIPFIVFAFLVFITKFVSLGSLLASALVFLQMFVFLLYDVNLGSYYMEAVIIIGMLVILTWFMHHENLKRLVKGEEKPFINKK